MRPRSNGGATGPSAVAEVLGPAGAGKSTLCAAVASASPSVEPVTGYRSMQLLPAYLRAALAVAPLACRSAPQAVDPVRQANWMIRLQSSPRVLQLSPGTRYGRAVLFDQGPAYTLVRLAPDGPVGAPSYERWWRREARRWAGLFNALILLDAPTDVLLARIRHRAKAHSLKAVPDELATRMIVAYRERCEVVAEAVTAGGPARLVRLDTGKNGLDDQVAAALAALSLDRAEARP